MYPTPVYNIQYHSYYPIIMVYLILVALYIIICLCWSRQLLVYTGIFLAILWSLLSLRMVYQRNWRGYSAEGPSGLPPYKRFRLLSLAIYK